MIERPDSPRPMTPQLALRVALLGGLALVLFGIVFFRLWFLQILSGEQYLARANDNRVRHITIPAPRGFIVDRNGVVLVSNRVAKAVQLEPQSLPPVERELSARYGQLLARTPPDNRARVRVPALPPSAQSLRRRYVRLGRVLGMSAGAIHKRVVEQLYSTPFSNVTLKFDADRGVYSYLAERSAEFPGVVTQNVFLRRYPHRQLASQLFGSVGQITEDELKMERFRGVRQGTVVGQDGLERAYDRYLRGVDGAARVQVDALGNPKGELRERQPIVGKQLRTSIDFGLQQEGERALRQAFGLAAGNGNGGARAGAFVAMDPRTGEVLAMGSAPSFDPNIFAKAVSSRVYDQLNSLEAGQPLVNRAIASVYPTGSTFKPITATAAMESGAISPYGVIVDTGSFCLGLQCRRNAGGAAYGAVDMRRALQVSSDVFFYTLGARLNSDRPEGGPLQLWAHRYGLGRSSGIDLPGESSGSVPSPRWRARRNAEELRCRQRHRNNVPCGYSDLRPWSIGDNVSLSVGQGDLQATPLQMAVAYSTLVNGGTVPRPHIGLEIQDNAGQSLQTIDPGPERRLRIDPVVQQTILGGLHDAATSPGGTSYDVFKGFGRPVYGKTGTAQTPKGDQSWYVCYAPDPRNPIVVAVTVEQGGFGAQAAAPAARLMLAQWFRLPLKLQAGSSRTL